MKAELLARLTLWDADPRSGVTGDWKIEQAIADKLLTVSWKRTQEVAWKSRLTNTDVFVYTGLIQSEETALSFTFNAKRNQIKRQALHAVFRALRHEARQSRNPPDTLTRTSTY